MTEQLQRDVVSTQEKLAKTQRSLHKEQMKTRYHCSKMEISTSTISNYRDQITNANTLASSSIASTVVASPESPDVESTPVAVHTRTHTQPTPSNTKQLHQRRVSMKMGGEQFNTVFDEVRDLSVDLRVAHGLPAAVVFDVTKTVLTAFGAEVTGVPTGRETATRFLVERETILFDDQVRRMAEANRPTFDPLVVRAERWSEAQRSAHDQREKRENEKWDSCVGTHIDTWRTKIGYNPEKDLPSPDSVDVGPIASSEDEHKSARCGMLFGAVDGTTFGR
eukprot:COSAG02_NODE_595_length_19813_cov_12.215380_22_plen_279_part_01